MKKICLNFGMKKPDEVNRIKELYEKVAEEFYFMIKDNFIIEISELDISNLLGKLFKFSFLISKT